MTIETPDTEVFKFLIHAKGLPDHEVEKRLKEQFERHCGIILTVARRSKHVVARDEATCVFMSYEEPSSETNQHRCRFRVLPRLRASAGQTYEYHMTIVNGKLKALCSNYALADRKRVDEWVSSLGSSTRDAAKGQLCVSRFSAWN